MTKPQDVVVALKLAASSGRPSYNSLAETLVMSVSEMHAAVGRLSSARLVDAEARAVRRAALLEFLAFGVPYAYPAEPGRRVRGLPTAWSHPALAALHAWQEPDTLVWPDGEGSEKGQALDPLYPSVPAAARKDPTLHALLALVDLLRLGDPASRPVVVAELERRLPASANIERRAEPVAAAAPPRGEPPVAPTEPLVDVLNSAVD